MVQSETKFSKNLKATLRFFSSILLSSAISISSAHSFDLQTDFANVLKSTLVSNGSSEMAIKLRSMSLAEVDLNHLRSQIQNISQGPLQIPVDLPASEIEYANKRLIRSGIDFARFTRENLATPPPPERPTHQTFTKSLISPLLVASTAAVIGWIAVSSGGADVASRLFGEPSWVKKISPFLAAGLTAAIMESQVNSQTSVVSRWVLRPLGFWGRLVGRDIFYPLLVTAIGMVVAAIPPATTFPSYGIKTGFAIAFSVLAQNAIQSAFRKLERHGEITREDRVRLESQIALPSGFARVTFLGTESGYVGAGVQTLLIALGTVPLWLKLLIGNSLYDLRTRFIFEKKEKNLSQPILFCMRVLEKIAMRYSFSKKLK